MRVKVAAALALVVTLAAATAALAQVQDLPMERSALVATAEPALVGPTPLSTGDFDGDGRDDLAVGVPREDLAGKVDAGGVHVLYGTPAGLGVQRSRLWTQGSSGVPGALEANDGFGWATTTGDFDGDGYDDLAVGAPLETIYVDQDTIVIFGGCCLADFRTQAGAVNILYGGPNGLTSARAQVWHQGKSGIKGKPQDNDFFGAALAAGDFNGDGRDELAIGVPGEDKGAGAVQILTGKATGLSASDQLWLQDTKDVDDVSERGDAFGAVLAAGNLGYSTREEDLAIGIPGEDVGAGGPVDAGAVAVLYGQPAKGLSATLVPDRFLHQDVNGVDDVAEARDMFGAALAIGDFGRSAQGELAVGIPGEGLSVPRQGAVAVFYGSSFGVSLDDEQLLYQGDGKLKDLPKASFELGRSLVAANFNGVSQHDLAIGSPYAGLLGLYESTPGAGTVHVIYGGPAGLTVSGSAAVPSQIWSRANLPPIDPTLSSELFGFSLAAGRFGRSPVGADLAASAPNAWSGAGFVRVVYGGGPGGLTADNTQRWHQNVAGIVDENEPGDRFGGG